MNHDKKVGLSQKLSVDWKEDALSSKSRFIRVSVAN